ncbi:MAG: hypothetical protein NUV84_05380, partial [Candidatus Uhrbacteria bacterium]|nr:hypothetical protein [Candidatus Uhrbacteria bacterium]
IRSMIRELLLCESKEEIFLFYSSRTHAEMAYEDELRDLATQYSNFYPVFCVTRGAEDGWKGECERVNIQMVQRYFSELKMAKYYMCGPVPFMDSIHEMLEAEGVDLKACLHREKF